MGWLFRNTSSLNYDGFKAKFLYNLEQINDQEAVGYSRNFELEDLYARRINMTAGEEPQVMQVDEEASNWVLVQERSKKICLRYGECVFIVGFKREFLTTDSLG